MRRALLLVLWPRVASGACTTEKKYQLGTTSATTGGRCRKRDRDGEGSCKGDSGSWDADTRCCLAIGETPSCLGGTTYEYWNSWWGWYGNFYVKWTEYGCYKNVENCPAPAPAPGPAPAPAPGGGGGGGGGGDNGGAIAGIVIGVVVGLCCCLAAVLAAVRYRRRAAEREGGTVAPAPPADLEMSNVKDQDGTVAPAPPADLEMSNEKGQGAPIMQVETVPPVTAPPQIVQPQPGPPMLVQAQILAPGAPVPVHLPVAELMPAASGFCAKCRAPLAAGAAFCGRCGQAV